MEHYKLRVDIKEDVEIYRKMEEKYFDRYVRCKESIDSNPHYHYYISIQPNTKNNLRQYIQKYIGKGNGVYSLKQLKEEYPMEYFSYMIKEDKNVVYFRMPDGFRKQVEEYHQKACEEYKEGKKKNYKKNNIEAYLKHKYGSIPKNREQMVEAVIQYHLDQDIWIRDYQIRSICQSLLIKYDEHYRKIFISNISEKL